MKDWLKFFGLGFFSDSIAKGANKRGLGNFFLGLIFALVFIFCGVLAANTVPFKAYYSASEGYKKFIDNAVDGSVKVVDGTAYCGEFINTFTDETSADKYRLNGYNLIVDTRPSDTYGEFEGYCISQSGKGEISYSDYLALTKEQRKDYKFNIRYTGRELDISKHVGSYESYLSATDGDIKKEYDKLAANKAEDYNDKVYALYLKAYYTPVSAFQRGGAPRLRDYYYREYLNDGQNFLIIFDDMAFSHFKTDGGREVSLYGGFNKMVDGVLDDAGRFIYGVYDSFVSLSVTVYVYNVFRFAPVFVAIPLVLALAVKLIMKKLGNEDFKPYLNCLNLVGCFMMFTSFLTAVTTFAFGFFASAKVLNSLPFAVYAAVITARTVWLLVREYIAAKRKKLTDN